MTLRFVTLNFFERELKNKNFHFLLCTVPLSHDGQTNQQTDQRTAIRALDKVTLDRTFFVFEQKIRTYTYGYIKYL